MDCKLKSLNSIIGFFLLKIFFGIIIISLSARLASSFDFNLFSQFFILFAYFNLVSTAGLQNGIIREIAILHDDPHAAVKVVGAATAIIATVGLVLLIGAIIFGSAISNVLVDKSEYAWLIPLLAVLAAISAYGQMLCAVSTGKGRVAMSLLAQASALIISGVLCSVFLQKQNAYTAVAAFAFGSALLPIFAYFALGKDRNQMIIWPVFDRVILARLLRFSGAFVITASSMPLALFLLRDVYRDMMGAEALSHWLAANRISDVLTQFVGVYMAQLFLPNIATSQSSIDAKRHIIYTAGIVFACMLAGLACYLLVPKFWVSNFLAPQFIAGISIITAYIIGDTIRVFPSLALYTALGTNRTNIYATLEIANALLFCLLSILFLSYGLILAPAFAYIITNICISLLGYVFLHKKLHATSQQN